MNTVITVGRLTKDPEITYTKEGTCVAKFILAEDIMNNKTNFHRCVAYKKVAENIGRYVGKGQLIHIDGTISYGQYEKTTEHGDKVKMYPTDIIINRVQYLGSKSNNNEGAVQNRDGKSFSEHDIDTDVVEQMDFNTAEEDIPF